MRRGQFMPELLAHKSARASSMAGAHTSSIAVWMAPVLATRCWNSAVVSALGPVIAPRTGEKLCWRTSLVCTADGGGHSPSTVAKALSNSRFVHPAVWSELGGMRG